MKNIKSVTANHNTKILASTTTSPSTLARIYMCNCRTKTECPLNGECLSRKIVYQAEVTSVDNGEIKRYIGITANPFKQRFRNHQKSFRHEIYANETALSTHAWKLKKSKRRYKIKWSIAKKAASYVPGATNCNLCRTEKFLILKANKNTIPNKHSELLTKCRHQRKFLAANVSCARSMNCTRNICNT